jgi:hypothetical protein
MMCRSSPSLPLDINANPERATASWEREFKCVYFLVNGNDAYLGRLFPSRIQEVHPDDASRQETNEVVSLLKSWPLH